jgi:ABC-type Fe3+/spermidine/putrescine transport system ATPase subunit
VAFPFARGRKQLQDKSDWRKAVGKMLHVTGLQAYAQMSIANLSGGEKQRVALARALVYQPSLLLLDEPLSSLDNTLRNTMLDLLLKLHSEYGTTFVYVTHDEREALRISTRIAILHEGKLCQYGPTQEVVGEPASRKVAEITGGWNLLVGRVRSGTPPELILADGVSIIHVLERQSSENLVYVGIPVKATSILPRIPEATDVSRIAIPVKLLRVTPWYERCRYDCVFAGLDGLERVITCYSDDPMKYQIGQNLYAAFRKEDVYVFPEQM